MHKLMGYICEELERLERKADKEGKLSMAEIEYLDKLVHTKKNLLKAEELWQDSEYSEEGGGSFARSNRGSYAGGGSFARGGRRGGNRGANQYGSYAMDDSYTMTGGSYAQGRYSGEDSHMMVQELHELMNQAPDDRTRMEFQKFIKKIEQM